MNLQYNTSKYIAGFDILIPSICIDMVDYRERNKDRFMDRKSKFNRSVAITFSKYSSRAIYAEIPSEAIIVNQVNPALKIYTAFIALKSSIRAVQQ